MSKLPWRAFALLLVAVVAVAVVLEIHVPPPMPRDRVVGREGMRQPRATPEDERIDPAALRAAAGYAAARNTRALIVGRHGHIVFEQYWDGTGFDTVVDSGAFNRTITALMVGMALDDRKIGSIDDPVADYLEDWRGDERRGITIRQLLEATDGSPHNANLQSLVPLIERATGQRYAEYVSRRLWKPLDAGDAFIGLDRPGGTAYADCCLFARQSDWMRIAEVLSNDGLYQGEEIAPSGWVRQMLAPSRSTPDFGLQIRHGTPHGGFYLEGEGKNRLWFVPSLRLAVLRVGGEPANPDDWDEARIPKLVMSGLKDPKATPATDLSKLVPHH